MVQWLSKGSWRRRTDFVVKDFTNRLALSPILLFGVVSGPIWSGESSMMMQMWSVLRVMWNL